MSTRAIAAMAALGALLLLPVSAGAANAAEATAIEVTPASAAPGSAVTVTATFVATADTDDVGLQLPPALVGIASWTAISSDPVRTCVVNDPDDGGAGCLWNSASIGETLIVTATLSIPSGVAEGQYDITTVSQITPTEATATLTVAEPAGPGDPQPQPGPEVLPDTGSSLPLTLSIGTIAALFIAAGIALTRRRATAAGGSEAHPQTP